MSDEITYRVGGWKAGKTTDILDQIHEFYDRAHASSGKVYPTYVMKSELEFLKLRNPSMYDWYDENMVVFEPMGLEPTLLERVNHEITKEAPTLNRADRRRLRKRKTR